MRKTFEERIVAVNLTALRHLLIEYNLHPFAFWG